MGVPESPRLAPCPDGLHINRQSGCRSFVHNSLDDLGGPVALGSPRDITQIATAEAGRGLCQDDEILVWQILGVLLEYLHATLLIRQPKFNVGREARAERRVQITGRVGGTNHHGPFVLVEPVQEAQQHAKHPSRRLMHIISTRCSQGVELVEEDDGAALEPRIDNLQGFRELFLALPVPFAGNGLETYIAKRDSGLGGDDPGARRFSRPRRTGKQDCPGTVGRVVSTRLGGDRVKHIRTTQREQQVLLYLPFLILVPREAPPVDVRHAPRVIPIPNTALWEVR
mmetsp:Transcript_10323/g.28070  ORF Transcript_10323/g.28070 Transcript_10323/m.28070 type:complete len:284 (+) Transcript_10323:4126-4977(+)